jgi:hypothetical protein
MERTKHTVACDCIVTGAQPGAVFAQALQRGLV